MFMFAMCMICKICNVYDLDVATGLLPLSKSLQLQLLWDQVTTEPGIFS